MISAYTRLHAATGSLRADAGWEWSEPSTDGCACCARPWADVEEPDKAVAYRYSAGMATEWVCTTCYTPRLGSYDFLGVERMAGKTDKTVPAKLGMLPGSGGVITAHDELYLALPPKNIEKFKNGWLGQRDRLFRGRPLDLLLALRADGRLGPLEQGIVFIEVFGRKADGLMADLRLTTHLGELWANSDAGARPIDLQAALALADVVRQHGLEAKAGSPTFWRPILRAAQGHNDPKALAAWGEKTPGAAELVAHLPEDPHDRLAVHQLLRPLLEASP